MKNFTVSDAAKACGAVIIDGGNSVQLLGKVVIDSRLVEPGDLFVAYKGERVDGHDYVPVAFEKGAACCLVEREVDNAAGTLLLVRDVQKALEDIAKVYRDSLDIPIVGVTGSVGKTTAKEMVSAVLSRRMNVLKTDKNFNNQIGVPMTLSRIGAEHDAAVVEMGISGFGEMDLLATMARPTIGLFTFIGHAHLEFLGDLDGVLRAKTEMIPHMPADGVVVINGDDEKLRTICCVQRIVSFGLGEDCDVRAVDVRTLPDGCSACRIISGDRSFEVYIPAYGEHMVYAALEGAAVGMLMGLSDAEIIAGIADYHTVGRRGVVTNTGHVCLVDDSYNSNPDSLRCAIDSLVKLPGRHICISSDMLEQGEGGDVIHASVGEYAVEKGVDLVLCCGALSYHTAAAAGDKGRYFESKAELIAALPGLIEKGDSVLVKASMSMHMEEVAEALKLLQ